MNAKNELIKILNEFYNVLRNGFLAKIYSLNSMFLEMGVGGGGGLKRLFNMVLCNLQKVWRISCLFCITFDYLAALATTAYRSCGL